MKFFLFLITVFFSCLAYAQDIAVGIFSNHADIGNPKKAGSASYDPASQVYRVKGGGFNIWFNRDEFHYLYKKINGDFILTANFEFAGATGNNHCKIGWMIRESSDEAAASMNAVYHGDGLTALQWRELRGAYMRDPEDEIFFQRKKFRLYN